MSREMDLRRLRAGLLAQERVMKQVAGRKESKLTVPSVGPLVRLFNDVRNLVPGQLEPYGFHVDPNSALPQIAHAIYVLDEALGTSTTERASNDEVGIEKTPEAHDRQHRTIFIGHGHSALWRELKDFIADTLRLPWDEFNRYAAAGYFTHERITQMLDRAGFALLLYTGEDELADGSVRTRENVVYETGLFQGRLGFRRAVVLREERCTMLSNLDGLSRLDFPKGNIRAIFEDVRGVLAREGFGNTS